MGPFHGACTITTHGLSEDWSYFTPHQAIYCDRQVSAMGRRVDDRGTPERRSQAVRRCGWFLLAVGRRKIVRIRVVHLAYVVCSGHSERSPVPLDGHSIRCTCGTSFEFEEVTLAPMVRSA